MKTEVGEWLKEKMETASKTEDLKTDITYQALKFLLEYVTEMELKLNEK